MSPVIGHGDFKLVLVGECANDDVGDSGRGGRRPGINHHHRACAHSFTLRHVPHQIVFRSIATIALVEGVFFIVNAILVTAGVLIFGLTGPESVSNPAGVTLEVVIFAAFGAGLLVVALGWWRVRSWARAPFVLAQLLALVVSVPLISSTGSVERVVGVVVTIVAVGGLIMALLPRTTAHLYRDEVR